MTMAVAVAALAVIPARALAGEPRFERIVMTDNAKVEKDKRSFTPTTPKIFLVARLADVPAGAKVSGVWIAEKIQGAPPNYKLDSTDLTVSKQMNRVTYSLFKPNDGWPVGSYRVELFIDGKPAGKASFKVAP